MPIGPDYEERTGENEALFREVNERLKERKRDDLAWQAPSEWVCECAEETCTERIVMSPLEYEQLALRADALRRRPKRGARFSGRGTDCRKARSLLGGREDRRSCRGRGGNRPPLTGFRSSPAWFQDSLSGVSKSRESLRSKRGRVKSVSDLRQPEPSLQLRLEAMPKSMAVVRRQLRGWLNEAGATGRELFEIQLAVAEAFANAVKHPEEPTSHLVEFKGTLMNGTVVVSVLRLRPVAVRVGQGRTAGSASRSWTR